MEEYYWLEPIIVLVILIGAGVWGYVISRGDEKYAPVVKDEPKPEKEPVPVFFEEPDVTEVKGIGPATKRKLYDKFGSPENMLEASVEELKECTSTNERAERLLKYLQSMSNLPL
jgi:hypothetical protein